MKPRIYTVSFARIYPLYIAKAEKKGGTQQEVDEIIRWLTGYDHKGLETQLEKQTNLETFFAEAPKLNPSRTLIKGIICGIRVEDIKESTMREIRYLDKLIDELAKGKSIEKILRKETTDLSSHGIVALVRNKDRKFLLLEDSRPEMQGHWAPPHGRCEMTDTTEENGVIREALEETGLHVTPIKKLLTQPADTKVKTVSFWLVDTLNEEVAIDESESSDYGWFSLEEALELQLYPGTRSFFEKVSRKEISLDSAN